MPKQRTGYVYYDEERKSWTARVSYKDELGRMRNIMQIPVIVNTKWFSLCSPSTERAGFSIVGLTRLFSVRRPAFSPTPRQREPVAHAR
jgi:hypothetical protein